MKLTSAGPSPFVRKVRVMLHETNQTDAVEVVDVTANPLESGADAIAANPTGKVPALIRDDGPAIYDSRVITRFLDGRAGSGLYPASRLWETLTLEATAEAIMEASLLMVYEHRFRPAELVFEDWIEAQWTKVSRSLDVINTRWMSHLAGPFDMSHIAVGCALSYLDFRHNARNWRAGRDGLAEWYESFAKRESMVSTAPE